jgi:hypothetical protein
LLDPADLELTVLRVDRRLVADGAVPGAVAPSSAESAMMKPLWAMVRRPSLSSWQIPLNSK